MEHCRGRNHHDAPSSWSAGLPAGRQDAIRSTTGTTHPATRHINAVLRGEEEPRLLAVDTALPVAQGLHDLAEAAVKDR